MSVEIRNVDGRPRAIVLGTFDRSDVEEIRRRGVTDVEVNRAKGFTGSLDMLEALPELEGLHVLGTVEDLSPVHAAGALRRLQLETQDSTALDFSAWPHLQDCYLVWRKRSDSLFDCRSLRRLYIYNFPDEDLERLQGMGRLERLHVGPARRLRSLSGVETLPELTHLAVTEAPKLISLESVGDVPQLVELRVDTCRKVDTLDPVAKCAGLRRLEFLNCGEVASLRPLAGLRALEVVLFYESTRVRDGDLSILLELPCLQQVSFANRRHYSHTREALTTALDNKRH